MAMVVHLVPGEQRCGLWCPKCLLPSGIEVFLYVLRDDGPQCVGKVHRCDECGSPLSLGAAS